MQIGMIGLGRMGANMTQRLLRAGHECVVYDHNTAAVAALQSLGAQGSTDMANLVAQLATPRILWLMLPVAVTDNVLNALTPLLQAGDIIIDGGNSHYHDDIRRAAQLQQANLHYIDVGVSGGVWGLERGYCLMIGGETDAVTHVNPIFVSLAPGVQSAPRTLNATDMPTTAEQGYWHCGGHGAGHFVKMVHNGIEYGFMAALAEGLNILHGANAGQREHAKDAETTPMRHPEWYQYSFDIPAITEVWRRGSVIGSWLLDLTAAALKDNPQLEGYSGQVADSGEGRWTVQAAVDEGVPIPVISAALFARFSSRGEDEFADKILSAMRHGFGGHLEKANPSS